VSTLLETLVTALVSSSLAALCLALLPHAPPRVRFAVAVAGLAAWVVPWGFVHVAMPAAAVPLYVAPLAAMTHVAERVPMDVSALLAYSFKAALLIGLALFAHDCLALRSSLRGWRATSSRADELRALLPPELAAVSAEIRVVADSSVAAASGFATPTIWIGDRHGGEQLRLILVHEMWHVRAHDPAWLALLAALRRAYWWNPLVAHLARQALLMIESTCDHRSATTLGKERYRAQLASFVLAGAASAPRLLAAVRPANLDVARLRLLGTTLRLRTRDALVVAMLGAGAASVAAVNVVELEQLEAAPATELAADSDVLDDLLSTYAYTPQQYAGEREP
jgi:hypothetical protein